MTRVKAKEDPEEKGSLDDNECPELDHLCDDGIVPGDDCKKEEDSLFVPPDTTIAVSYEVDAGAAPSSATKTTKTPAVKEDDTKFTTIPTRSRPFFPDLFNPHHGPIRYDPNVPSGTSKLKLSPSNCTSADSSASTKNQTRSVVVTGEEAARLAEVTRATYRKKRGGDGRVAKVTKEMTEARRREKIFKEQRKRWAKLPKVMRR